MMHDNRHIIRLKKIEPVPAPAPVASSQGSAEELQMIQAKKFEIRRQRKVLDTKKTITLAAIAVLLIFCVYLVAHSLWYSKSGDSATAANISEPMTAALVLQNVRKLMLVPNEEPAIAIVKDLSPLHEQQFFMNAQLGDYLLMFSNAGKAILYRPLEDRIIEVAPIINH